MVMSTDTNEDAVQEQAVQTGPVIEDAGEVTEDPQEETQEVEGQPAPATDAQNTGTDQEGDTPNITEELPELDSPVAPELPQSNGNQAAEIAELQRMRQTRAAKEWEDEQIRQAQQIENRAIEQGIDPQGARQMARQHLKHQKTMRDQDGKAVDLVGFVEGKNNAAMHFAGKYKLLDMVTSKEGIEVLRTLSKYQSPSEMDYEARRMAQMRSMTSELNRLKQGSVKPQTFDSSQGSAEVTTNQNRLLEMYGHGDRSEAARNAARKLTLGS